MAGDIVDFRFDLVPAFKPEYLHENMRSSVARNLPVVTRCHPHDGVLSIAGGGPSLGDTYGELTGYVAAMNGSLGFLLSKGVVPQMCGVCDPSPHMLDIVAADPRVTYFLASTVHPLVYDKLINAGCSIFRWNISSIPGGEKILDEIEPNSLTIGGGSTMGLRWITLGYNIGFRDFHIHGLDSSFRIDGARPKASHAYPDHQDAKDWIGFDDYWTRPNFIGQLSDFIGWMERLKDDDVDPVKIEMFGEGLLQSKFTEWKALNPDWHTGGPKPKLAPVTEGFIWPEGDQMSKPAALVEVQHMGDFIEHVQRRNVVVQAGGNVGVYPANLARHFREVHTFEPDPGNYACLSENIKQVKRAKIVAWNAALGDRDGTCGLKSQDHTNMGAVQVAGDGDVEMRRLDSLQLPACDLIWLDVEGYELNALMGAEKTIETHWPAVIIEDNGLSANHGIPKGAAIDWLHERGYVFTLKRGNDKLYLPTC